MSMWELLVIAIGLSMDAFAVSVGKGLSVPRATPKHAAIVGVWFGGFQALMPLIGYLLGTSFRSLVTTWDHWIAFVLLVIIGFNMIRESREAAEENLGESFGRRQMFPLAIATSIDALAVGVSLAFLDVSIVPAVAFIGIVTLVFSAIGLKIGNVFGAKYKSGAELFGGIVLILIGAKILLEHLGILG